jgi:hypothetical protein
MKSGHATMIDVQTIFEHVPKTCLNCLSIRTSRVSASGLKEFYGIRYGTENFGVSITNIALPSFSLMFIRNMNYSHVP